MDTIKEYELWIEHTYIHTNQPSCLGEAGIKTIFSATLLFGVNMIIISSFQSHKGTGGEGRGKIKGPAALHHVWQGGMSSKCVYTYIRT